MNAIEWIVMFYIMLICVAAVWVAVQEASEWIRLQWKIRRQVRAVEEFYKEIDK